MGNPPLDALRAVTAKNVAEGGAIYGIPANTHWHVGYNMPGYLPEGDVDCYPTWDDARLGLYGMLQEHADSTETWADEHDCDDIPCPTYGERCPWNEASDIRMAADEVGDSTGPEITVYAGNLAYWIQLTDEDCEMED